LSGVDRGVGLVNDHADGPGRDLRPVGRLDYGAHENVAELKSSVASTTSYTSIAALRRVAEIIAPGAN
jgi:hypothetical protein